MLYNPLNKKQQTNLLIFCLVLFLLGILLSFVSLLRKDIELLIIIANIFSVLLLSILILFTLTWFIGQFHCKFKDEGIIFCWSKKRYRVVSYSEIKGISICGAVNYAYYPITNSEKKQLAIVTLYKRDHIAAQRISPHARSRFPSKEDNCICRTEFRLADLEVIAKYSQATIFVSEDIFTLYKPEMSKVFSSLPKQVMISHQQPSNEYPTLSTYETYMLSSYSKV